jgi:hypothetical protein
MRKTIFTALIGALLAGCATSGMNMEADYVARQNADPRIWPPVVEGQAFPVQTLNDAN